MRKMMAVAILGVLLGGCGDIEWFPEPKPTFSNNSTATNVTNRKPTANAGQDATATVLQTVTLNGAGSSDPDGDILGYKWEIISKPTGSNSSIPYSLSPTPIFVPDQPGEYVVQLTVNDGKLYSLPATVKITVADTPSLATDSTGNILVRSAVPFELFRDGSNVKFGINVSVENRESARANISLVFEAKDAQGNIVFTSPTPLDMGLDPSKVTESAISSFTVPVGQFDSISSWGVATLVRY